MTNFLERQQKKKKKKKNQPGPEPKSAHLERVFSIKAHGCYWKLRYRKYIISPVLNAFSGQLRFTVCGKTHYDRIKTERTERISLTLLKRKLQLSLKIMTVNVIY